MGYISKNWNGIKNSLSLSEKLLDKVKPGISLKNRIDSSRKQLQSQINRLEETQKKLHLNHERIFKKIVNEQMLRNESRARAYAIELQELRKVKNTIGSAKLAMEQIQLRLNTVSELGDIVVTLSPCMSIIKGLAHSISSLVPGINNSMQDLSNVLGDMMSGSSISSESTLTPYVGNADTAKILEEAHAIIEGETQASMPEPPIGFTEGVTKEKRSMI